LHRRADGYRHCVPVCLYAQYFRLSDGGEICHRTRRDFHPVREPSRTTIHLRCSVRGDSSAVQSRPPNIFSLRELANSPCEYTSVRRFTDLDERAEAHDRRFDIGVRLNQDRTDGAKPCSEVEPITKWSSGGNRCRAIHARKIVVHDNGNISNNAVFQSFRFRHRWNSTLLFTSSGSNHYRRRGICSLWVRSDPV